MFEENWTPSKVPNLVLFGYKASGKSYFGQKLAQLLHRPFIDTDLFLEDLYEKKWGQKLSCRQIAQLYGEAFFRSLEYEVVTSLKHVKGAIIALGGGAVIKDETLNEIKHLGILVYLDLDKKILKKRIFASGIPSFLDSSHPDASFEKMYQERQSIYTLLSTLKVVIGSKRDEEVLDELKALADIQ